MKENPSPVTLLTLTGYHDYNKFGKKVNSGKTLVTCYDSIKYGYYCLSLKIRRDHPTAQWFGPGNLTKLDTLICTSLTWVNLLMMK